MVGGARRGWTNKANLNDGRMSSPAILIWAHWAQCFRSWEHRSLLNLAPLSLAW